MTFQLVCTAILALVVGFLALVAGYRLFLFLLPIWGFFAGFAFGAHFVTLVFGTGFLSTLTSWIAGFVAGLIFAILSYLVYIVGVALLSAAFGYFLGAGVLLLFFEPGLVVTLGGLAGAVLMAFLVLAFNVQKAVLEFITSFGGATAMLTGILLLFGAIPLESLGENPVRLVFEDSLLWFVVWLVIGFVGFGIQIAANRSYVIEPPANKI